MLFMLRWIFLRINSNERLMFNMRLNTDATYLIPPISA